MFNFIRRETRKEMFLDLKIEQKGRAWMFLKRIELSGFKSFANKTVIQFDQPLTGIVGPNGCGKSNITDAIRWVLGEQSAKALRSGQSLGDIIFAGSESKKAVNMARATLVFDNTQKIFDSPYDEIEITRQISRGASEISNYINKTPCRLKDIQDLVMDTGLGRDSLSIISQGNISSFADAKPEERRLLFEEAAGVAKYKKRKRVSLAKLENVKNNLDRVQDLIDTHNDQVDVLEEQAKDAIKYIEAKEELASIEISVLAIRIGELKEQELAIRQDLEKLNYQLIQQNAAGQKADDELETLSKRILELDGQLARMQREKSQCMEESMQLQKQKAILDERRKNLLSSEDEQARRQSLIELFGEAKFEYEDRRNRLNQAIVSLQGKEQQLSRARNELQGYDSRRQLLQNELHHLENELAGIESRIAHPPYRNHGVQAVMKNQDRLAGIHGLVSELLECDDEYLSAITTALSSASEQIVVDNEGCARAAINWLKRSQSGRATFLPLSVCKARTLADWQQQIAKQSAGILGVASDFVRCLDVYEPLKMRLLGSILVARDLECANDAARKLKQSVKIVTLGGDVVHAGGAMTGGSMRQQSNPIPALKKEKARLEEAIQQKRFDLQDMQEKIVAITREVEQFTNEVMQSRIEKEKLDNFVQVKREKYQSLQLQISQLDLSAKENEETRNRANAQNGLIARLSELHQRMDEIDGELTRLSAQKQECSQRSSELNDLLRTSRREQNALSSTIQQKELELARIETRLEQNLSRLSADYALTYEAALEQKKEVDVDAADSRIKTLRKTLSSLGNVNLAAPDQLKEIKEKYEFLVSQKEELEQASKQILEAVDEMDQTMTVQFEEMFNRINDCLDEVFKAMFGGGKAKLVLCDPNDLLNTGVDVDVQPPGKAVKNMSTFSGGEKALIAISVLFAILKARTVPLCIFDEVEAALDQANVERFAKYLSNFKDQSQFITVTHRPGTMEQCDTLYGVTMQQDGVSQVLKVMLKDATEMSK